MCLNENENGCLTEAYIIVEAILFRITCLTEKM